VDILVTLILTLISHSSIHIQLKKILSRLANRCMCLSLATARKYVLIYMYSAYKWLLVCTY